MNGKSILITGGTGSFGKKFTECMLKKYKNFTYNLKENNQFLTVSQLRKMIKNEI